MTCNRCGKAALDGNGKCPACDKAAEPSIAEGIMGVALALGVLWLGKQFVGAAAEAISNAATKAPEVPASNSTGANAIEAMNRAQEAMARAQMWVDHGARMNSISMGIRRY